RDRCDFALLNHIHTHVRTGPSIAPGHRIMTRCAPTEVGMGFAGSDAGMLNIQGMGFFAPDMITFYGADPAGAKTQLVQHVSQLNVMLKAAPKLNEEPARIGFQMRRKLEDQGENAETAD
ncbi:MAG: DUF6173 family protein, partial [Pseudomonadota bacterium]